MDILRIVLLFGIVSRIKNFFMYLQAYIIKDYYTNCNLSQPAIYHKRVKLICSYSSLSFADIQFTFPFSFSSFYSTHHFIFNIYIPNFIAHPNQPSENIKIHTQWNDNIITIIDWVIYKKTCLSSSFFFRYFFSYSYYFIMFNYNIDFLQSSIPSIHPGSFSSSFRGFLLLNFFVCYFFSS